MNNDLISRDELLKRIDEEREYLKSRGQFGAEHILVHNFRDLVENAPTVEQFDDTELQRAIGYADGYSKGREERPQGEWIRLSSRLYKCKNCGFITDVKYPFCHCGADMRKNNAPTIIKSDKEVQDDIRKSDTNN